MKSVCMATYNGAEFIKRQLDSILEQLNSEDEVIIVDDGSTDETIRIIEDSYPLRNIKIIKNEANLGSIKSFEKSIQMAKGDYLFLADQDDIWFDNKVSVVMESFKKGADLVVHDAVVVDGQMNELDSSWNHYNHNNLSNSILKNTVKNAYTGCMMAFKRERVESFLPFPEKIEMHDQWIAQVSMKNKYKITVINQPLMYYVRHGGNVTGMKKRSIGKQIIGRMNTLSTILMYKKEN